MSGEQAANTQLHEFIKRTLTGEEANDEDIVSFVKLVGQKMIKGEQGDQETKELLKQVLKDEKVIESLLLHFSSKGEEDKKRNQKEQEEANKNKLQMSGKAVINKSQSDIPDIYKETTSRIKNKPEQHDNKRASESTQKQHQRNDKHKGKKGEKDEIFNRMVQDEQKHVKQPVKKQKRQNDSKQENIVLKPDLQGKSKCKFFPYCTNQKCQYFHPTQKCPHFPRCRFKQNCLFIHEACKFGESCTRNDCFYDHPFKSRKSNNPLLNMMKMMMAGGGKPMIKKTKKPIKADKPLQQEQN